MEGREGGEREMEGESEEEKGNKDIKERREGGGRNEREERGVNSRVNKVMTGV